MAAVSPTVVGKSCPYVGPRPFTESEGHLFFGRTDEAADLVSLTIARQAVVVYSQSGTGKTSLLNAKVIPLLGAAGHEVHLIRVGSKLPVDVISPQGANVFLLQTALSLHTAGRIPYNKVSGMKLADLFTLTGTVLDKSTTSPRGGESAEETPLNEGAKQRRLRILIFDQFEEFFTSFPDRNIEREEFLTQVGELLEADRLARVLFSLREEYVACLDPFCELLPDKLRTRRRLNPFSEQNAREAITGPVAGTGREYGEAVVEELISDLFSIELGNGKKYRSDSIQPVQLQVACYRLWTSLPAQTSVIELRHLKHFGSVDASLEEFYGECVRNTASKCSFAEGRLRRWFENRLIVNGRREGRYRGDFQTDGIPNQVVDFLLSLLILRSERRSDTVYYEIAHDRFIRPIQLNNKKWVGSHLKPELIKERDRLSGLADRWSSFDKDDTYLLKKQSDVAAGLDLLSSTIADDLGFSDNFKDFIETSRKHRDARQLLLLKSALVTVVILACIVGGLATSYVRAQRKLTSQQQEEERQREQKAKASALTARAVTTLQRNPSRFIRLILQPPKGSGQVSLDQASRGALHVALYQLRKAEWLESSATGVTDMGMSQDGRFLATGSVVDAVSVWDMRHSQPVSIPSDLKSGTVSFSAGSRLLLATGQVVGWVSLDGMSGSLNVSKEIAASSYSGAAAAQDETIATYGSAGVQLWHRSTTGYIAGKTLTSRQNRPLLHLRFSLDSRYLLATYLDRLGPDLWDTGTGEQLLANLDWHPSSAAISFDDAGRVVGIDSAEKGVYRWDPNDRGKPPALIAALPPEHRPPALSLATKGDYVAIDNVDNSITVLTTSGSYFSLPGHDAPILAMQFSNDGSKLISADLDGHVAIWPLRTEPEMLLNTKLGQPEVPLKDSITAAAFSSATNSVLTLAGKELDLWGLDTNGVQRYADLASGPISVDSSATNLLANVRHKLALVNTASKATRTLLPHSSDHVAISPTGNEVVAVDGTKIAIWNETEDQPACWTDSLAIPVSGLALSSDGSRFAAVLSNGTVLAWSSTNCALVMEPQLPDYKEIHESSTPSLTGLPIVFLSNHLLVSAIPGTAGLSIWDPTSHLPDKELFASGGGEVGLIAASRNDKYLAAVTNDRSLIMWDIEKREVMFIVPPDPAEPAKIMAIGFTPDSSAVLTLNENGTWKTFLTGDEALIKLATRLAGTQVTLNECEEFEVDSKLCDSKRRLERAEEELFSADVASWTSDLQQAKKLDPSLNLDSTAVKMMAEVAADHRRRAEMYAELPGHEARARAVTEIHQVQNVAHSSDKEILLLDKLREIVQLLDMDRDPNALYKKYAASARVRRAVTILRTSGAVAQAVPLFLEAEELDPAAIAFTDWNALCWWGTLAGHARKVLSSCDRAVEGASGLASAGRNSAISNVRDSRGLARAFSGNPKGAIADLTLAINLSGDAAFKESRRRWISLLRNGQPIPEGELQRLRHPN